MLRAVAPLAAHTACRRLAFILTATIFFVAAMSRDAEATHFRYATVSWRPTLDSAGQPTGQVEFRIRSAWRRGFFSVIDPVTHLPRPPIVGETIAPERFDFGDGSVSVLLTMTVTSVGPA